MNDPTQDVVVYLHPNGRDYVANLGELGWLCWPAERGGWQQRKACSAELAERCDEMPRTLALLALLLSGVHDGC